jgi:hypothetical protein
MPAAAATTAAPGVEGIADYAVAIQARPDGSIHVRERIAYTFPESPARHGIQRLIPVRVPYDDGHERVYPISNVTVSSPSGAPAQSTTDDEPTTTIRIGDPDRTVSGTQTYVLQYDVRGVVNSFSDHQEVYWNAIGTQWQVPIDAATVRVTGPAAITGSTCFHGPAGSTATCTATTAPRGTAAYSADHLAAGEGMTVVANFPPGTFPAAAPILQEVWTARRAFTPTPVTVGGAVGLLALIGGGVLAVARMRRRRTREAVQPPSLRGTPPETARPGELGTVMDGRADVVDVTATLVDLAVRGVLRIEEVAAPDEPTDWRLVRTGASAPDLRDYEQALIDAAFRGEQDVLLSGLRYTFRKDLRRVQELLHRDVAARGWFRADPAAVRRRWGLSGVLVVLAGIALTALLAARTSFGLLGVGVVLGGIVVIALASRMPVLTASGEALAGEARGYQAYLEAAGVENSRLDVNAFSRALPYAMVLGCARHWTSVFAGLADRAGPGHAPTWYVGHGSSAMFNYALFGTSLDQFSTTTATSLAAAPPSSSGVSGSGAGGYSGGGAGGGGGGSW